MSAQTFGKLVMAQTDEEKRLAKAEHRKALAEAPTDAENISAFLAQCRLDDRDHPSS